MISIATNTIGSRLAIFRTVEGVAAVSRLFTLSTTVGTRDTPTTIARAIPINPAIFTYVKPPFRLTFIINYTLDKVKSCDRGNSSIIINYTLDKVKSYDRGNSSIDLLRSIEQNNGITKMIPIFGKSKKKF